MPGYRHCSTESAAERQRQFENALLELMEKKSLDQISIQEICDRVGLSRKSFYRYFSGKEACLYALVDHAILGFTNIPLLEDRMQQMLEEFFLYWMNHKELLDALCKSDMAAILFERAMHYAVEEYGIRSVFQENDGSYDRTVFFISGLVGVLLNWQQEGFRKSPSQLAQTIGIYLPKHPWRALQTGDVRR